MLAQVLAQRKIKTVGMAFQQDFLSERFLQDLCFNSKMRGKFASKIPSNLRKPRGKGRRVLCNKIAQFGRKLRNPFMIIK